MSDKDIEEYHNIGRKIPKSEKYTYVDATRTEEHGSRLYDVNGTRLPSVTTILGKTKNQQFIKDWKEKVGEAEAERNKALFRENLASYHKVVLRAFQEVEDSLSSLKSTQKRIDILVDRQAATKSTLRVANDNYFEGLTEYLNVISSQIAYFNVESELLLAKRQKISAWIGLMRALGYGGSTPVQKNKISTKKSWKLEMYLSR